MNRLVVGVLLVGACAAGSKPAVKQEPEAHASSTKESIDCFAGQLDACREGAKIARDRVPPDFTEAQRLAGHGCDAQHGPSCRFLALLHLGGAKGVDSDPQAVARFYQRACDLKDSDGCQSLGWLYQEGIGVKRDLKRATDFYKAECERGGNDGACASYRANQLRGLGTTAEEAVALRELETLCSEKQIRTACTMTGLAYESGLAGRDKNQARAIEIYEAACAAGSPDGCEQLGRVLISTAPDRATLALRTACEGFRGNACSLLADLAPAAERASLAARACVLGVEQRCQPK